MGGPLFIVDSTGKGAGVQWHYLKRKAINIIEMEVG